METKERAVDPGPLPRSTVYITQPPDTQEEETPITFRPSVADQLYLLILTAGDLYTDDVVNNCRGRRRCYYCMKRILKHIYFIPLSRTVTGKFRCNPVPFCCPEHVLGAMNNIFNMKDKEIFTEMYGHNVQSSAPNWLPFLYEMDTVDAPNVLDEADERMRKEGLSLQHVDRQVRATFAPVLLSAVLFKHHRIASAEAIEFMNNIREPESSSCGPIRARDNSTVTVKTLGPKYLTQTPLSQMFQMDPDSIRPNESQYHYAPPPAASGAAAADTTPEIDTVMTPLSPPKPK